MKASWGNGGIAPPVPIRYEADWVPEPVWALWRRGQMSLPLPGIEPRSSSPRLSLCTHRAVPGLWTWWWREILQCSYWDSNSDCPNYSHSLFRDWAVVASYLCRIFLSSPCRYSSWQEANFEEIYPPKFYTHFLCICSSYISLIWISRHSGYQTWPFHEPLHERS